MNQPLTREQRIQRIRQQAWREAEEAHERRMAAYQTTAIPANGARRSW